MTVDAALASLVSGLTAGERGEAVHVKGDRTVWRVTDGVRVWYAKGATGSGVATVRAECRVHAELARRGLPVAELLSCGASDGREWIVTAAAPGVALDGLLRATDAVGRRRALDAVARSVRSLHAAGVRAPDLTAVHAFVADDVATHIDLARAEIGSAPVTARAGSADLAALLCSLPFGCVDRGERVRLVRVATGARGASLRDWFDQIARRARKLRLRTRWRHAYAGATTDFAAALAACRGAPEEAAAVVAPEALYLSVLDPRGMTVERTLPDRENRRLDAPSGRSYFVKLYPPVRQGLSPAMHELDALELFARSGVPVCRPVAYGEDLARGSFVVLRGCDGAPLDDVLRGGVSVADRRLLARRTGELFRRLRQRGLHHRDAYPCHLFAAPRGDGFELRFIDLTRAGSAPFPRERWFVKDAAQFWYGLPKPPVTRTDAVRFLRAYCGVTRLDAAAKRFARRVAAKAAEIERRQSRRALRRGESS